MGQKINVKAIVMKLDDRTKGKLFIDVASKKEFKISERTPKLQNMNNKSNFKKEDLKGELEDIFEVDAVRDEEPEKYPGENDRI